MTMEELANVHGRAWEDVDVSTVTQCCQTATHDDDRNYNANGYAALTIAETCSRVDRGGRVGCSIAFLVVVCCHGRGHEHSGFVYSYISNQQRRL